MALARRANVFRRLERELADVLAGLGETPLRGIVDNGDGTSSVHSAAVHGELCASAGPLSDLLARHTVGLPSDHPLHAIARFVLESGPVHFTGPGGQ